MVVVTPNDGWRALAESTIKWAIRDMKSRTLVRERYFACKFLTNEKWKDLYTGLAPNMIRDWEKAEVEAEDLLKYHFYNYDPNKKEK